MDSRPRVREIAIKKADSWPRVRKISIWVRVRVGIGVRVWLEFIGSE